MNMPSSISQESQLSAGLRVDGRAQKSGVRSLAREPEAAPSGAPRSQGVAENFKSALAARLERYQKSGQSGSRAAEDAQALADSLAQAAAEVKDVYGQAAANKFMAGILQSVDERGLSFETLTAAVSGALKDTAQAGTKAQFGRITEAFNRDLGRTAEEEDGRERSVQGLSRSLNDFFQTGSRETDKGLVTQGFDAFGNWGEMVVDETEAGGGYLAGAPEAARQALEASSVFSLETLGQETVTDLTIFLRDELGAFEAADFLESAPEHADFMSTLDRTIGLALRDIDGEGAAKLEQYLNDQVKTAVNASSEINRNPFGEVEFEGWSILKGAAGGEGEAEATFESRWRYTNRDDVTYARTGQAAQKPRATEEEEDESAGPTLGDLVKKIADRSRNQTGELVDTQA